MPTVLRIGPVRLCSSGGFNRDEINKINKIVEDNKEHLLRSWNEYFIG